MRNPSGGGAGHAVPGFLSPFRLSAFASWVILRPLGSCTFLTVGLPTSICRTPTGLSCCTWARPDRAGRPLDPGDGGALPTGDYPPAGTRRFAAASPYTPLEHPIGVVNLHETSSRVHSRSPITPRRLAAAPGPGASPLPAGLLLACRPRMEREPLRLLPRASHPAVTRDARRGGDRPSRT